jgi:SsrA-binding protein
VAKSEAIKVICVNRKARYEFEVHDTVEAGLELTGSEVKALRGGHGNLAEAYVRFENGEAWLVDAHISPYAQASRNNHEAKRTRKLLLQKGEILRWAPKVSEKGLTVIPLRMYFKGAWAKVEIALARGKKLHDKRQSLKEADDRREMAKALKPR